MKTMHTVKPHLLKYFFVNLKVKYVFVFFNFEYNCGCRNNKETDRIWTPEVKGSLQVVSNFFYYENYSL